MAENTGIEWATHTFNPWWGCTKVSPACDHCYAETWAGRFNVQWGNQARRRFFEDKHWNEPKKWDRKAKEAGERHRVFCSSMADVFELLPPKHPDAEAMAEARDRLWTLITETPHLDWLLLTKRPQNALRLVPDVWGLEDWPQNAWIGTTAESQEFADQRVPHLLKVPAPVRFLSCEPLLGPLDLSPFVYPRWERNGKTRIGTDGAERPLYTCQKCGAESTLPHGQCARQGVVQGHVEITCPFEAPPIHWVIVGGESGSGARPMHPDWARRLRDHCQGLGVAFHFKQWGEWAPGYSDEIRNYPSVMMGADGAVSDLEAGPELLDFCRAHSGSLPLYRAGKKAAGRMLQGRTWDGFPVRA